MERDGKEGVHLDGSMGVGVSRLEVIEGPSGRRRRTTAERARIAAESLMPGVRVADVARKHGTTRWQVYDWRKKLRTGCPRAWLSCRCSRNWWSRAPRRMCRPRATSELEMSWGTS